MMDDTNPFAPSAALPRTTTPAEPEATSPSAEPEPPGLISSDSATLSPAAEKFKSCRWRATPDVGDFCTHRDVLPFAGKEGFVADSWCPDCAFYKLRRTPKKRERIDFSY